MTSSYGSHGAHMKNTTYCNSKEKMKFWAEVGGSE